MSSAQSNLEHTLERQSSLEDLAVGLVKKSEDLEKRHALLRGPGRQTPCRRPRAGRWNRPTRSASPSPRSIEFGDQALRRCDRGHAPDRQLDPTELDETRAEIKKGVFEMPVEAKESTTAIRRAVSEQINALKELSEIVAKSGRSSDVVRAAQPARLRPQAPAAPRPPSRSAVRRRRSSAAALRRRSRAPLRRRARRCAARSISSVRPKRLPAPARAPTARTPQGGWVRDLLTGASREEDATPAVPAEAPRPAPAQRSPLQVVELLNSLSVDIARAIDHDASIELWDRYRRGERDVFTRRLYTLKGQQTFDEIRRKYQSDGEFRAAVDRYCEDFEKLLKDVARNDRDNVMTQTYLTSDTGKVYTMLAHASGRLR